MRLGDDSRIEAHDDAVAREVNGEAVLLHLETERYYVLDASTTQMWQVLIDASNLAEAVRTLHSEFDVEIETLRDDLQLFVGELVDAGLATIS